MSSKLASRKLTFNENLVLTIGEKKFNKENENWEKKWKKMSPQPKQNTISLFFVKLFWFLLFGWTVIGSTRSTAPKKSYVDTPTPRPLPSYVQQTLRQPTLSLCCSLAILDYRSRNFRNWNSRSRNFRSQDYPFNHFLWANDRTMSITSIELSQCT